MGACDPVADADELVLEELDLDDLVDVDDSWRRTNVEETVDGSAVKALFAVS